MDACHRGRLRQLTKTHRTFKSAPYRGITPKGRKWAASIRDPRLGAHNGRCFIGTFNSPQTAAVAYDFALMVLGHQPFNFSLQHYRDSYPEGALRASLAAVRARLRPASYPCPSAVSDSPTASRLFLSQPPQKDLPP